MGGEVVSDSLKSLGSDDRRRIGEDLATVQFGCLSACRFVARSETALWEVRTSLASRRIARLIFFFDQGEIGLLNGFIKKTPKTPPEEIALARKRMKEMIT